MAQKHRVGCSKRPFARRCRHGRDDGLIEGRFQTVARIKQSGRFWRQIAGGGPDEIWRRNYRQCRQGPAVSRVHGRQHQAPCGRMRAKLTARYLPEVRCMKAVQLRKREVGFLGEMARDPLNSPIAALVGSSPIRTKGLRATRNLGPTGRSGSSDPTWT